MKDKRYYITALVIFSLVLIMLTLTRCGIFIQKEPGMAHEVVYTNKGEAGNEIVFEFTKGEAHNYPLMALWIEDTAGKYIETLYVAESIGKGIFNYGQKDRGKWMPGEISRPAALPYWAHKRGIENENGLYIPTAKNPVPDAITGATPIHNFSLHSVVKSNLKVFNVMFEINQTWDWNEYWINNKYPENEEYKTSCQPALVYLAKINLEKGINSAFFEPIGHSHFAGKDGSLTTDLSTITTALDIAGKISVEIKSDQ